MLRIIYRENLIHIQIIIIVNYKKTTVVVDWNDILCLWTRHHFRQTFSEIPELLFLFLVINE